MIGQLGARRAPLLGGQESIAERQENHPARGLADSGVAKNGLSGPIAAGFTCFTPGGRFLDAGRTLVKASGTCEPARKTSLPESDIRHKITSLSETPYYSMSLIMFRIEQTSLNLLCLIDNI
jgi:hypothetical protein